MIFQRTRFYSSQSALLALYFSVCLKFCCLRTCRPRAPCWRRVPPPHAQRRALLGSCVVAAANPCSSSSSRGTGPKACDDYSTRWSVPTTEQLPLPWKYALPSMRRATRPWIARWTQSLTRCVGHTATCSSGVPARSAAGAAALPHRVAPLCCVQAPDRKGWAAGEHLGIVDGRRGASRRHAGG